MFTDKVSSSLSMSVYAYTIPEISAETDNFGNYSIILPSSKIESFRVFVQSNVNNEMTPKSNTIRIGVVDTGVGIKDTLQKFYHPKNDLEAIKFALTPGVTGTTKRIGGGSEMNAGAGLFFIKSLAKTSRDFFMIYTGRAMYKLLKNPKNKQIKLMADPLKDHYSSDDNLPFWKGTVVAIDLCLDDNIDFKELLTAIKKVYGDGKKNLIKERYKKPRFI